jgi:hypothetical protein
LRLVFEKIHDLMCNQNEAGGAAIFFRADELLNDLRRKFTMEFFGDVFRVRATTIVMSLLFACAGHADFDYNADFGLRSYPLSGALEGNLGYGLLLWGTPGSSPMYGYVRPHVGAATAGYYNSGNAVLDVYPLSFLGGSVGGEAIENDKDYSAYDCAAYQCRGRSYRSFAQAELSLAAGPLFSQFRWKRERWTLGAPRSQQFIETTSGLALDGQGDFLTVYRGAVGVKYSEKWSLIANYIYAQSDVSREVSRFPFAVVRFKNGPYSISLGGGVYSSTIKAEGGSVLLLMGWNLKPGLGLN